MNFNANCYRDNILTELRPLRPQTYGRQLVLYADSVRAHTARKCQAFCTENRVGPAVHQLYSLDLALSGFFLFGNFKHLLQGAIFASCEELLASIHEIVAGIPQATLQEVFQHWMEKLEWASQNNGDYYP
jgi:hypothetical protein